MAALPRTILLAPDSFKGTLRSCEVAEAVQSGLREGGWETDRCPAADGGEGTLEVLADALGGERIPAGVEDPLGRTVQAEILLTVDRLSRRVAVVESAQASGLCLLDPRERDAWSASTFGTGELLAAAVQAGAELIYLGVGGSATTDGGGGALRALRRAGGLRRARLVVLCDVRSPFEAAPRLFGPQKGADAETVRRLERRLAGLARRAPRDPRGVPFTGAAGGLAGGLWSHLGAELVAGAPFVLDLLDFDRRMRSARAVVTGEGCLDEQSLAGKLVSEVATRARQNGVPCHAIVARRELDDFGLRLLDIQVVLEAGTPARLREAGRRMALLI